MPKNWLEGVATFLRNKNATDTLENYRPLTLINIIYKKLATIRARSLDTVLNLLISETQYAYKQKRSTIGILAMVNNVLTKNDTHQLILFNFCKTFGEIERDIMWAKLYEDEIPFSFVKTLKWGMGEIIT